MVVKSDPQVKRFRQKAGHLFPSHCRAVVAVSGGADSLALMHLLVASRLLPRESLLIAHFDHGLRVHSKDDAQFVIAEAHKLGLSWSVGWWQAAQTASGNEEERARQARYQFLQRCAHSFGAERVVTGHHRDDQAETFLERLLRGSSVRGLSAMPSARILAKNADSTIELVRPLLFLSRGEIQHWLVQHGFGWREDASNQKLNTRRNRIRHETLPSLQKSADGNIAIRLAATAERMAQAESALAWMLSRLWSEWDPVTLESGGISLAVAPLLTLPDELLCRCLHHCHRQVTGDWHPPNARAVAGFVHLIRTRRQRWAMVMQGLIVQRQQERLIFLASHGLSAQQLEFPSSGKKGKTFPRG